MTEDLRERDALPPEDVKDDFEGLEGDADDACRREDAEDDPVELLLEEERRRRRHRLRIHPAVEALVLLIVFGLGLGKVMSPGVCRPPARSAGPKPSRLSSRHR